MLFRVPISAPEIPLQTQIRPKKEMLTPQWCSIPNLKGKHKRYLYGPGSILVAHSDHEHLKAIDLLTAVEGYKRLVRSALKS